MRNKKILIPLFQEYYLFEYFKYLVPTLCSQGHKVYLLSFNDKVLKSFENNNNLVKVSGNRIIRFLYNRNGNYLYYIALWPLSFFWGHYLKLRYQLDFCILPWDNKTIWYNFSKVFKSLTIHNTTEYIDLELTLNRDTVDKSPLINSLWHKFYQYLDDAFSKKFFYRGKNKILFYDHHLFWDRLFGKRSKANFLGFSQVEYITVTGNKIKENLMKAGLSDEKIKVLGNPSYDFIDELRKEWNDEVKEEFCKQHDIPLEKTIYTLFLSPSKFSDKQRGEVTDVLEAINEVDKNSYFIVKFHPKTRKIDPPRFKEDILNFTKNFQLITDFGGDLFNAKLMLVSKAIVQKQCTLGFLAIRLKIPMISYDLVQTDYEDDMYKRMKASLHCESINELKTSVEMLDSKVEYLYELQVKASENYSLDNNASISIGKLISTF